MKTTPRPKSSRPARPATRAAEVPCTLRILNAIRRMIRVADLDSRALAAKHDITAPQLICLLAIVNAETATSVQVARLVHLSPSTLVGILDRLEEKGLIKRTRSVADRRAVSLAATAAGRQVAAKTPFPLQAALDRASKHLTVAECEQAAACMERLVSLMSLHHVAAGPMLELAAVSSRQER